MTTKVVSTRLNESNHTKLLNECNDKGCTQADLLKDITEKHLNERSSDAETNEQIEHNIELGNVRKVYCSSTDDMEPNWKYKKPLFQCAACSYPIPLEQAPDKDNPNGRCPRCNCNYFENYKDIDSTTWAPR